MSEFACDCSADWVDAAPSMYRERLVVARKDHRCCECGEVISRGQKYNRADGMWDGAWGHWCTCVPCQSIRKDYCPNGWYFGGLREQLMWCLDFDYLEVPEEDE